MIYYQNGGVNNQAQRSLTLSNAGNASVSYSILATVASTVTGQNWMVVSPLSGLIPAGGSAVVTVGYDATKILSPGTYSGLVTVLTSDGSSAQQNVPVKLIVATAPLLNVLPTALHFFYGVGGTLPIEQVVTLAATNSKQFDFYPAVPAISTSTTDGGAWLLAPARGTVRTAFPVAVAPQNLSPGEYQGTISVAAGNTGNSPQMVPVVLTVVQGPVVQTGVNFLSFPYQFGSAYSKNVAVTSNTGAPLSYTATAAASTCGPDWLLLRGTTAGTTDGVLIVISDPTGMAAESCSGTVIVDAMDPVTGVRSSVALQVFMYAPNLPLVVVTPSAPLAFATAAGSQTDLFQLVTVSSV